MRQYLQVGPLAATDVRAVGPLRPDDQRVTPRSTPTWADTLGLLEAELHHLRAVDAHLLLDVTPDGLRRSDGWPKVRAAVGPLVVVEFTCEHGRLRFHADQFTHWQANVRAVADTLVALRRVDRPAGDVGHQYRGWVVGDGAPPPRRHRRRGTPRRPR